MHQMYCMYTPIACVLCQ